MIALLLLSIAACAMDSSDSMFDVFEDLASHLLKIGQSGGTKVTGPITTIKGTGGSILDSLEGIGYTAGGHPFTFAGGPFYEIEFWYGWYKNYFGGLRVRNKDGWVTPSGWWATNGPLGYGRGTKESVTCSAGISSLAIVADGKAVLGVRVGCACASTRCLSSSTLVWSRGGCRQHFTTGNFLAQYKGQTAESCACKCRENRNCKMFNFGRSDDTSGRSGWCNLYRNACTNNGDPTWDAYTPGTCLSLSTLAWSRGGCQQHFTPGNFLAQYKGQTAESCACKCRENAHCKMFFFGRADDTSGRAGWCNLYRNVCTNNGDPTWDAYTPQ